MGRGMAAELDDLAVDCDQSGGFRALCVSLAQIPNGCCADVVQRIPTV
jgi:hypothetical protein